MSGTRLQLITGGAASLEVVECDPWRRGVDLVAIQQLLGHWTVSSTMRYVRPSVTFIEDAYRRAVAGTLGELITEDGQL